MDKTNNVWSRTMIPLERLRTRALESLQPLLTLALDEDIGPGDLTSDVLIDTETGAEAEMVAKDAGTAAGLAFVEPICHRVDGRLEVRQVIDDGTRVVRGDVLCRIAGPVRPLLTVERTLLNFVQALSGIATYTARYVDAVKHTGARILDTRKTTPNLRMLEKYAVTRGGGHNHRSGLFDMALIKDNHLQVAGSIEAAVTSVRARFPGRPVEVEAATLDQVGRALQAGADRIMLDNMDPDRIRQALDLIRRQSEGRKRPRVEVSGNVTLENIGRLAMEGVDDISIGSITHSSTALDISLEVTEWAPAADSGEVRS
jgi:nicotinate-nucleotide pyrophosphorylase (carboxylating)